MKNFMALFENSAKELKSAKCLAVTAMMITVSMVIEFLQIPMPFGKINFAFIAIAIIGMLYGPSVAFMAGGLCDIVGYIVKPDGAFLPIYVFIAMLQGLIYGILLYKKQLNVLIPFALVARLIDVAVINLLCNTAANMYYGFIPKTAINEAIIVRLVKNILELFVDIPLLVLVLPAAWLAYRRVFGNNGKTVQ